jgi:hypothetical protein
MTLDEDTFMIIAAKHYDMKRAASVEEFYSDVKRFQYVKRLFSRYHNSDDLKTRLILNHLTIIYNCFGPAATPMLFMKLEGYHKYLKPFVLFLNFMQDRIEYDGKVLLSSEIALDERIVEELRKI